MATKSRWILALSVTTALVAPGLAEAQSIQPLPTGTDSPTLAAVMQNNAQNSGEYHGGTITLPAGVLTPGTGGSLTDAQGNVWTLPAMDSWPAGNVALNGQLVPGGDYTAAIGLTNGTAYFEDAKGGTWWTWNGSGLTQLGTDPFGGGASSNTSSATNTGPNAAGNTTTAGPATGPGAGPGTAQTTTTTVDAGGGNQPPTNPDGSTPMQMISTGTGGNQNSTPCPPPAAGTAVASTKSSTSPSTTTTPPSTTADGQSSTTPSSSSSTSPSASSNTNSSTTPSSSTPSATASTAPPSAATPFAASGTRDPSWIPFASDSVYNLPLGLNAQWEQNNQLSSAGVVVNTADTGFNQNIYTGTAQDPVVQVTTDGGAGGSAGSYTVHIPAAATPAAGSDGSMNIYDAPSDQYCTFGVLQLGGNGTATAAQASCEPASGDGLQNGGGNWTGVGAIRAQDLQSGSINHMLRVMVPSSMAAQPAATTSLTPNAWPQTMTDGFAISGNGGPAYSGTVPYGVTVGIPALDQEPPEIKANPGADMLWRALQTHGAMIRDTAGNEGSLTFQTDQNVTSSDPLIQGMMQYGSQVMAHAMILANQGPNSVNGGGTPIVPLLPPVAGQASVNPGDYGSVQGTGCSAPGDINSQLSVDNLAYRAAQNHASKHGNGVNPKTGQSSPGGLLGAPNGRASDQIQAAMDALYKATADDIKQADALSNDAASTQQNKGIIGTLMNDALAEIQAIKAMTDSAGSSQTGSLVQAPPDATNYSAQSPTSPDLSSALLQAAGQATPTGQGSSTTDTSTNNGNGMPVIQTGQSSLATTLNQATQGPNQTSVTPVSAAAGNTQPTQDIPDSSESTPDTSNPDSTTQ